MNHFLEIGPGTRDGRSTLGPEWDTLDVVGRPTYRHDAASTPYPVPAGRYELVYASHVLEHVPWYSSVAVLVEWRRLLRPGGRVEVWVPDFQKLAEAYATHRATGAEPPLATADNWWRHNEGRDPFAWLCGRLFNYAGNPNTATDRDWRADPNWHRAAFDRQHLARCLTLAGFVGVEPLASPRGAGRAHGRRGGRPGHIELGLGAQVPEGAA